MRRRAIELYGRLKDAGYGACITLDLPPAATARQALAALKKKFGAKASLLEGCALATGEEVLSPSDRILKGRLAALPPVCGG